MRRLSIPIDAVDIVAIVGVLLLAVGIGARYGWDIATALVGFLLLVYAVLITRQGGTS